MPRGINKYRPGARLGVLSNTEGGEGGGTPPAPAGPPANEAPKPTPPAGSEGTPKETDWASRFEAQRSVNRDLESKFNALRDESKAQRDALAAALGLKPEEASDTEKLAGQVTGLSKQLEQLTRANLVLSVVNEHPNLSDEDKKVVAAIPDEATMRTVAARLAEASKPSSGPKNDPPSNGGGGDKTPVDTPGIPRLRAAYAAAENTN